MHFLTSDDELRGMQWHACLGMGTRRRHSAGVSDENSRGRWRLVSPRPVE